MYNFRCDCTRSHFCHCPCSFSVERHRDKPAEQTSAGRRILPGPIIPTLLQAPDGRRGAFTVAGTQTWLHFPPQTLPIQRSTPSRGRQARDRCPWSSETNGNCLQQFQSGRQPPLNDFISQLRGDGWLQRETLGMHAKSAPPGKRPSGSA